MFISVIKFDGLTIGYLDTVDPRFINLIFSLVSDLIRIFGIFDLQVACV